VTKADRANMGRELDAIRAPSALHANYGKQFDAKRPLPDPRIKPGDGAGFAGFSCA
jgi:hypothetical protein